MHKLLVNFKPKIGLVCPSTTMNQREREFCCGEMHILNMKKMNLQDQMRALDMIREDSELSGLTLMQAPLVDMEIRGVPALRFLGDIIWK